MRADPHTGERIRQRREELGLSQRDLDEATSYSYAYVSRIESGARVRRRSRHSSSSRVRSIRPRYASPPGAAIDAHSAGGSTRVPAGATISATIARTPSPHRAENGLGE
jgi:hypothetical protein